MRRWAMELLSGLTVWAYFDKLAVPKVPIPDFVWIGFGWVYS